MLTIVLSRFILYFFATKMQGCEVRGKISDSNSGFSKISDTDFPKFLTPDSGLSKISDSLT